MASLQEQLLKAGLTTKQKARQANTDKRKKNKQKRSGANVEAGVEEQVKNSVNEAKLEKHRKDQELNAAKQKALAEKEANLRIKQILTHHQIKDIAGEVAYNYTFDNKVKKLHVDEKTHTALSNGRLAVCGLADSNEESLIFVVTRETADKVAELAPSVVLVRNERTEEQVDEDDPYAEFQIPDDLMW